MGGITGLNTTQAAAGRPVAGTSSVAGPHKNVRHHMQMSWVILSQPSMQVRVSSAENRHQAKQFPSHAKHGEWHECAQEGRLSQFAAR